MKIVQPGIDRLSLPLAMVLCGHSGGWAEHASGERVSDWSEGSTKQPDIINALVDEMGVVDVQRLNPERGKIKTSRMDKIADGTISLMLSRIRWLSAGGVMESNVARGRSTNEPMIRREGDQINLLESGK